MADCVVYFAQASNIGVNQNGTAQVKCPICGRWCRASFLSSHLELRHAEERKRMAAQARQIKPSEEVGTGNV